MLLLIAALAVWLACLKTSLDTQRLERQLPSLRNFARELQIDDPNQFTAVRRLRERLGEAVADIYVPPGGPYELCLALDNIDTSGLAEPVDRITIASGTHTVEILYERNEELSVARVMLDGKLALTQSRPKDWESRTGSIGGMQFGTSRQYDHPAPWVLFRKRFIPSTGPTEGILVWIQEKVSGTFLGSRVLIMRSACRSPFRQTG